MKLIEIIFSCSSHM